ncbi:hypothetical protein Csa_023110 [Cucumis sativus]|nr:hypothetical protein Csa_023110 [Cucumis sativus]
MDWLSISLKELESSSTSFKKNEERLVKNCWLGWSKQERHGRNKDARQAKFLFSPQYNIRFFGVNALNGESIIRYPLPYERTTDWMKSNETRDGY